MERSIVIAGGASGLGLAVATEAVSRGYSVALLGRDPKKLEKADTTLKGKVSLHAVDLSDSKATQKAIGAVRKLHPKVVGLVNCAATWMGTKKATEYNSGDMLESFSLNFLTTFHTCQEILKTHKIGKDPLAIINIGATAAMRGSAGFAAFCTAKGAVRSYSQSLAKELGPQKVHVAHFVIDGVIDNPRTRDLNKGLAANRYLSPESLAKEVLHVLEQSPDCWTFEWDARPYNEKWN